MRQKLLFLSLFFLIGFLMFLNISNGLITYTVNSNNDYYVEIPSKLTKQTYNLPIGHYFPINWSNMQIGDSPINFAQKIVGTNCKLYVDNAFSYPEKALRFYDATVTGQIITKQGLTNATTYSGSVDFIVYVNSTLTGNQHLAITLFNSSSFIGRIFDLLLQTTATGAFAVGIMYREGGYLLDKYYYFPQTYIMQISVEWNFLYNKQNVVGKFQNQTLAFNATCNLAMNWNSNLYAASQWLQIATGTGNRCDMMILGIDASVYSGFYRYRSFTFTYLNLYGYYSSRNYNIPLTDILPNVLNARILKGNISFSINSNSQQYNWVDINSYRVDYIINNRYNIFLTNLSSIMVLCQFFDANDYNQQIIKIRVNLTLMYDYIDDSLFNLYLNAALPLILLIALPLLFYKVGQEKRIIFWIALFLATLGIVIWQNLITSLGGIVAIVSFMLILLVKFREGGD